MHDRIEAISHRPKTNSAYSECRTSAGHIKHRIVSELKISWEDFNMKFGRNLRQSEDILELYGPNDSDKNKTSRINEFVDNYSYDLSSFLRAAKRRKESPNKPIDDNDL